MVSVGELIATYVRHISIIPLTSLIHAGDKSFQKAAPMLNNALPVTIKTAPSLAIFNKSLKTYLFTKAYMVKIDKC